MKRKVFMLIVAVFSLSLLLTACAAGGPSTNLKIHMTDFMFDPTEFTVPAGQTITVTATNDGAVEHEFVIFKLGTDAGDKFGPEDEDNIYWEVEAQPGESITETFVAPSEAGEYFVTCGIVGHLEAGMLAKLTVVSQ